MNKLLVILLFLATAISSQGLLRAISGADNLKSYFPFRKEVDNTFGAVPSGADISATASTGKSLPTITDENILNVAASQLMYYTISSSDLADEGTYTIWVNAMSEDVSDTGSMLFLSPLSATLDSNIYVELDWGDSKVRHRWDDNTLGYSKVASTQSDDTWYWIRAVKSGSGSGNWVKVTVYADDNGRVGAELVNKQGANKDFDVWDPAELSLHFGNDNAGDDPTHIEEVWIYSDSNHGAPRP